MTPFVRFISVLLFAFTASAAAQFQPQVGQSGKDVIWVPTPDDVVERMLTMAQVTPNDYVWDLGAGDGKIAIMAAKKFGARATGIEYNPDMVKHANANAQAAGVSGTGKGQAQIRHGDIFQTDFSHATVVTLYLLPSLNVKLRPTILKMKPGTRVVSHAFTMDDWQADQTENVEGRTAYLWIVPAQVGGKWQVPGGELTLKQSYQMISGVLKQNGKDRIVKGRLNGDQISFAGDGEGPRLEFSGRVSGSSMQGTVKDPAGEGKWSATRSSN